MSTFESSYKSLLQGVSQQIPRERLPGQLTAQLNMLSDPVTNLRRRPGAQLLAHIPWASVDASSIIGWFTDVAGTRMHILLNTNTGVIVLLDGNLATLATLNAGAYLQTGDRSTIRAATVGNEFFLCNTTKKPALAYGSSGHMLGGFVYIVSGAFSKSYDVTVTWNSGGTAITASYTTPSGAGAGDAALATPDYIAAQLAAQLGAHMPTYRVGPYIYVYTGTPTAVNTTSSTAYVVPSKNGIVSTAGNLPARLPGEANGFICRVGTLEAPQYFQYSSSQVAWLETGAAGSPSGITNMPVSVYWTGSAWALNTSAYEGRSAGDDKTNTLPEFVTQGISGMATYQGRLVLLSGPMVSLSGAGKPRRFFRSTITAVVDSDPIEIGSAMNSSAAYEHAIPFQKDLILLSSAYQAVIPSNNTALTPKNATVVPTSSHEVDVTSPPIALGRTLMYATPRSGDFFGVREMVPSPYTDSQYVSHDATPHLPKYMGGRCRFSVSSSVANMALFAPSGDLRSLIVHEYMWDGDQKVQQAWHTWTFPYDVATAYFAYDKVIIMFAQNDTLVITRIDPRIGVLTFDSERRPFLDLWSSQTVTAHVVGVPAWMLAFDPAVAAKLQLTASTGNLAGDRVGATVEGNSLRVVRSFRDGAVAMGVPYRSSFSPTPPVVRDYNDVAVSTNKATLLRYILGTKNSQEFKVRVVDRNSTDDGISSVGTLLWSSLELELGRSLYSTDAASIIPCRTNTNTTVVDVYTKETGELNAVSLEYVLKTTQKIKRR